jgi:hypothetical protein
MTAPSAPVGPRLSAAPAPTTLPLAPVGPRPSTALAGTAEPLVPVGAWLSAAPWLSAALPLTAAPSAPTGSWPHPRHPRANGHLFGAHWPRSRRRSRPRRPSARRLSTVPPLTFAPSAPSVRHSLPPLSATATPSAPAHRPMALQCPPADGHPVGARWSSAIHRTARRPSDRGLSRAPVDGRALHAGRTVALRHPLVEVHLPGARRPFDLRRARVSGCPDDCQPGC